MKYKQQTKNIIVGGGLAGLLCAWNLEKKGLPYLLLEAKSDLGGRIYGVKVSQSDHYHDLGPTWIFPHQHNIQRLLDEIKIPYFEQFTKGDALFEKQGTQGVMRTEGAGAASTYRVSGGMKTLIDMLFSKLCEDNIKTEHVVKQISKCEGDWIISASHKGSIITLKADNLILALPPRMITEHLTPKNWASTSLINTLQKVPTWMAAQAKFVATYKAPFWREDGLSGQVFSQQGPMQEIHDACSINASSSALFGFIGIPSRYREKYQASQIKQACLSQLNQLYGEQATLAETTLLKDWATDEFVASKDDINEPASHPNFSIHAYEKELSDKNIFLAGSEFSQVDAGYLEGAVCAVNKVIKKIIQR